MKSGRGEIIDSYPANAISTFGGNPMATSAALATLDVLLEEDLQTNSHKVGNRLKNGLDHLADEVPQMVEVRGKGLMIGVELADPDTLSPDPGLASAVLEEARTEGLIDRQRRPVRKRAPHRPSPVPDRRRMRRGIRNAGNRRPPGNRRLTHGATSADSRIPQTTEAVGESNPAARRRRLLRPAC